ncbi:Ig-like domain-containing protein [Actinokineospora fastidiosa]|uniref:Ig-like domain-containing protein n=1 Tax=Actinokineospora fastidiosa TaxID=1816 RepID=UPI00166FA275|nr:Ig-like domain-containing protein [Actinokineospora fastidiosa]
MNFIRRHRTAVASATATAIVAGALVAVAINSDGFQALQVDLDDGGIWVTSAADGMFGRLNKPAGALDAGLTTPGPRRETPIEVDVAQDGAAVIARDVAAGVANPVDVLAAKIPENNSVPMPAGLVLDMRGGTAAVLDPTSGKVWAMRVDRRAGVTALGGLDPAQPPVAQVDADAALAVGVDGTVWAVSASGKSVSVSADGTGFGAPVYGAVQPSTVSPKLTVVGATPIVLDPATGRLDLSDGRAAALSGADDSAELQQPGVASDAVGIATGTALLSVALDDGAVTTLWDKAGGKPATPVRHGDCLHAAWAATDPGYVRSCAGNQATPVTLRSAKVLSRPRFRVNRGSIVLNDLADGAVWDLDTQQKVDNWQSLIPPPARDDERDPNADPDSGAAQNKPPKANDDRLGARPGRTTVLHLLDNDSDPASNILAIASLTDPAVPGVSVSVAPDGQTAQVSLPEGEVPDFGFRYTVDDGKGLTATAAVSIEVRVERDNEAPRTREGYTATPWNVVAGGRLSIPALAEWRDYDGDPIALTDAVAETGSASTTPTGFVEFTAPAEPATVPVTFHATDGRDEPVEGTERIEVQDAAGTTPAAPVAEPDVVRGQVNQPIMTRPLDNDRPGADPASPAAELQLAGVLNPVPGIDVKTDLNTGVVTVTATAPGTYFLEYSAAFGNAPFNTATIRVDAAPAPRDPLPPVAVPDNGVLRGQQPATVDVLANDFDPSGALLAVQHAAPAEDAGQVQVAVIAGRWLRISAVVAELSPNPQVIRYTVTNGVTGPVTGEVTVTQLAPPADDTPVPKDDRAVVRAGDSVAIPVLDNDTTPGGSPMTLQSNVDGAPGPGMLSASGVADPDIQVGRAYVTGSVVRYVPPETVQAPQQVLISYVVQNPNGDQAVGRAHVTVNPAPTPQSPNQKPAPSSIEGRVVAGDIAELAIPTSGVDPDGDSVTVVGVGSAAALGRVVAIGATSVTYEAYPTSAGTDSVSYLVTDRFGATELATIRLAVVPPGDSQPLVAVDDIVTAAPGARVTVDLAANDLRSPGDHVTVEDLAPRNPELPEGTELTGTVARVTAPEVTGKPLVVVYAASGGSGTPSTAALTVRSREDYNNPPQVQASYARPEPGDQSVTVDVLEKAFDPDGPPDALTISGGGEPGAAVSGGEVTLPVGDHPRTVAFEVRDAGGATTIAMVHVLATNTGAPYVKPDALIEVGADASVSVPLAEHVVDPAGKPVRLTLATKVAASPATGLTAKADGDAKLTLTGTNGYNGPGAVTFEVTNGDIRQPGSGQTVVLTIPVQVGAKVPVLRCPTTPVELVAGGATVPLDITSVCHVWTADRDADALDYFASWTTEIPAVDVDVDGRTLSLTAGGAATPDSSGALEIGSGEAKPATLAVAVIAAPRPSVAPVAVDGIKAGDSTTIDMTRYVRSALRDPVIGVVSARQSSGMAAEVSPAGATVRISPGADTHGTMTFDVTVTDVADTARADRHVTGRITLRVLGVPDAPGVPRPGRAVLSKVVELSWSTPPNNGAPIDVYEIEYDGGSQTCPASPCAITGLTNGTRYTFTVRARNLVGWSEPSGRSAPAQPNTVPGAVGGLAADQPRDGTLRLTWTAAPNEGSPVLRHDISWTGGGRMSVPGGATTANPPGLDNDAVYTFTVIPVNAQGPGPAVTARGQSAGVPDTPGAPRGETAQAADRGTQAVTLSWEAVGPNGRGPTTYTVNRTGGGAGKVVCADVTALSCVDAGLANDGTIYTYTVTAANYAAQAEPDGHTSPPSPGTQMEASNTPDEFTGVAAAPTGQEQQAVLRFDAPASRGRSNTVTCSANGGAWGGCGTWTFPTDGAAGQERVINGLVNGSSNTLRLRSCNGSTLNGDQCTESPTVTVVPFGPVKDLAIDLSTNGPNVSWSARVNPNGKPATVQVTSTAWGGTRTYTTGAGPWSVGDTHNIGYSTDFRITVVVTDPGRAEARRDASTRTGPPPPPPSVTVSKGSACSNPPSGGNPPCGSGTYSCVNCNYIVVQTANFSGPVTCRFTTSDLGGGGFVNENFGPNERRQTRNFYGGRGRAIVNCDGVEGSVQW